MSQTSPANTGSNDVKPKPLVGITMGEPAGIGPEVVVKALADPDVRRLARFIIFGFNEALEYAADEAEINPFWFRVPHETVARIESGVIVADFDDYPVFSPHAHCATAEGGHASMRFLDAAINAARNELVEAIVTAPICKESWHMAGYRYPGHTEKLGHAFKTDRLTMMFVGGKLRVALASIHEALFDLRNSFTIGRVFQPIDLMATALRQWFGMEYPRIAVCGLNPHAGEGGLFGDEEKRVIEPAITMAREAGWFVEGPYPADTVFWHASHGRFDGVVAMYHDQGLIPVKLLAFETACQTTLGLPIIRTSVDHGTAFDIAGQNTANPESMKSAIRLACHAALCKRNQPQTPQPEPTEWHELAGADLEDDDDPAI